MEYRSWLWFWTSANRTRPEDDARTRAYSGVPSGPFPNLDQAQYDAVGSGFLIQGSESPNAFFPFGPAWKLIEIYDPISETNDIRLIFCLQGGTA